MVAKLSINEELDMILTQLVRSLLSSDRQLIFITFNRVYYCSPKNPSFRTSVTVAHQSSVICSLLGRLRSTQSLKG